MADAPDSLPELRDAIRAMPEDERHADRGRPLVEAIARLAPGNPEALALLLEAKHKAGEIRGYWMGQSAEWSSAYESFMGGAPDKEPPTSLEEHAADRMLGEAHHHIEAVLAAWEGPPLPDVLAQALTDAFYELP